MENNKVLIIEDDESVQELLKTGLEGYGFSIEIATDEKTCKEILERTRPDIIIMDISLPGIDGISLCREIKLTPGFKEIPVIMMTAYHDNKIQNDSFLCGAIDYIIKPIKIEELKEKILKYIK